MRAPQATSHKPRAFAHVARLAACSLWLVATLLAPRVLAQDIHFSQFFHTPLASSPGNIGAFDGDYRVHGIFRQQWRAVTQPYRTFGLGGDAANAFGKKGLGVGAWLFNDKAGDSRMNTFHFSLGGSYTLMPGGTEEHAVTLGAQVGLTSISITTDDLRFDAQYNGFYYDPNLATGESFARGSLVHPDVHAGAVYRFRPAHRQLIQVGLGFFNLTRPKIGFLNSPAVPLDMRTTFQLLTQFPVSERVDVLPMIQYMAQGRFKEFDLGATVRYVLVDRYTTVRAVRLGGYYRASDAGYVYAGVEYDDWTAGISYDVNVSDLVPASRNRGGIEISVTRVFRKQPLVPARFKACPHQL